MALFGGPSTPVSRLKELKKLLQKDPTSRQFLALAEEYRRHGKYRDAVITLERGLQVHSTSVAAHVALGRTYRQLDRLEDAICAFTNALRLDRENLVAIRQLAEVYLATGDKIEAIKKLKLYCGLKAGDRDVNDIIQKLEEEMSAAMAERPRSGVQPVFSDFLEAPKLPPFTAPIASIREQPEPETAPFDVSDARPEAPAKGEPLVSETLGDLYRAQGHLADARETYRTLAETAADEARARALREKAAALPPAERTDHPRLRRLARRFPKRPEATVDHLHGLLSNLVEGTEGIRAAALTDLKGLLVVMAGPSSRDAAMETLVAELSSFLKNVRRTTAETGTGELESLVVAGPNGGVVVSPVNADYSLILRVDPEAALGEIRWEAARTARALRPAVR